MSEEKLRSSHNTDNEAEQSTESKRKELAVMNSEADCLESRAET